MHFLFCYLQQDQQPSSGRKSLSHQRHLPLLESLSDTHTPWTSVGTVIVSDRSRKTCQRHPSASRAIAAMYRILH